MGELTRRKRRRRKEGMYPRIRLAKLEFPPDTHKRVTIRHV